MRSRLNLNLPLVTSWWEPHVPDNPATLITVTNPGTNISHEWGFVGAAIKRLTSEFEWHTNANGGDNPALAMPFDCKQTPLTWNQRFIQNFRPVVCCCCLSVGLNGSQLRREGCRLKLGAIQSGGIVRWTLAKANRFQMSGLKVTPTPSRTERSEHTCLLCFASHSETSARN